MQMTRYSLRLGSHVQHLVASVAYKRRFRCYWSFTLSSYSIVPPEGRRELWLFHRLLPPGPGRSYLFHPRPLALSLLAGYPFL